MKISQQKIAIIISLVFAGSLFFMYPLLLTQFPNNGTVDRTILFVKSSNNETPYFIMLDDISTESETPIEWIQHGMGDLALNESEQAWSFTTTDYFEGNTVKLYGKVITDGMEFESGMSFTSHNDEQEAPYLIVKTKGSQQLVTLLIPLNESMIRPEISILKDEGSETCFLLNHSTTYDLFWSRFAQANNEISEKAHDWLPKAQTLYLRSNQSNELYSLGFINATELKKGSVEYFDTNNPVSGTISLSGDSIEGTITTSTKTSIKLRTTDPGILTVNGKAHDYSYNNGMVEFSLSQADTYILGGQFENVNELEVDDYEKLQVSEIISEIEDLTHPYLIFEEDDISSILSNLQTKEPLNTFYGSVNESADSLENLLFDGDDVDFEDIEWRTIFDGIIGWIFQYLEGDKDALDNIKMVLTDLNEYHYTVHQTLHTALVSYSFLIAFDAIYNDLSEEEQASFTHNIKDYMVPLAEPWDITPLNNHLGVNMGAVGLAGLVTKDQYLLDVAIKGTERFLEAETYDGVPVESFNYAHFGYESVMPFLYSLKRLEIVDYFKEEGIMDRFFERTLDAFSPTGIMPHYEDVSDDWRQPIWPRLYSHLTDNEDLRKNIAYILNIQNQSTYVNITGKYIYLELFTWKDLPTAQALDTEKLSWVSYKGGNAALRTDWSKDAVFISMNAKTYQQSHTHLDELSYEIYAYGAMLAMNTGYPGWKKEHHADTVSSFGSNTIRLNDQDQLQEICDGFSAHLFSEDLDMVSMDGGNLYRSPFTLSLNPILYIIVMLLQIGFALFAVYNVVLLKKEDKRELMGEADEDMAETKIITSEQKDSKDKKDNEKTSKLPIKMRLKNIHKPKFAFFLIIYLGMVFRLIAFAFSILRKMFEWSYTEDVVLINTLLVVIWFVIILIPALITVFTYLMSKKIKKSVSKGSSLSEEEITRQINSRITKVVPFIAVITSVFVILFFLREYNIMDYISKDFGTITAFADDFLEWALFNLLMISLILSTAIALYLYIFRGIDSSSYQKVGTLLALVSLIVITSWFLLSIFLHYQINQFTIETWFA